MTNIQVLIKENDANHVNGGHFMGIIFSMAYLSNKSLWANLFFLIDWCHEFNLFCFFVPII